jgi:hypothetical protein
MDFNLTKKDLENFFKVNFKNKSQIKKFTQQVARKFEKRISRRIEKNFEENEIGDILAFFEDDKESNLSKEVKEKVKKAAREEMMQIRKEILNLS